MQYINDYTNMMTALESARSCNPRLARFARMCKHTRARARIGRAFRFLKKVDFSEYADGLDVASLLILPVQHLPRHHSPSVPARLPSATRGPALSASMRRLQGKGHSEYSGRVPVMLL